MAWYYSVYANRTKIFTNNSWSEGVGFAIVIEEVSLMGKLSKIYSKSYAEICGIEPTLRLPEQSLKRTLTFFYDSQSALQTGSHETVCLEASCFDKVF